MQALILAAGMGSRLKKYTRDNTKCMVEIAGKKIIDWTLDAISFAGIRHVIMVIGYKGDKLRDYITSEYSQSDFDFDFIVNDEYAATNNIYSLYLASGYLSDDDTVLIESDIIFEKELIKNLVDCPEKDMAVVAHYKNWMSGTVVTCKDGHITRFIDKSNMDYNKLNDYYKTVNIYKFSKEFCKDIYIKRLKGNIDSNNVNRYYEDVLRNAIRVSEASLYEYEIGNMKWYEVDDSQDLEIANAIFASGEERYDLLMSKFGGYWRYSGINDFCYLVNPYFPTKQMIEKMKSQYEELIGDYPSSLNVQNLNAERIFNVDKDMILVGNGASELINVLGWLSDGKMSVPVPTFNEYIRCFNKCKIKHIDNRKNNFIPNIGDYLKATEKSDLLCIVNPDNPSGFMFTEEKLLSIVEEGKRNGTRIIVDESFVDFADSDMRFTLLNNDILRKYPNLIVIRSIGKTYGVAGFRLGVLASGDKKLIKSIKGRMPIWNINSFGEYYLQIYNDFSSSYIESCELIAKERKRVINELKKIKGLTVYPSQANYVMFKTDCNSRKLCIDLLGKGILVKDLSKKDFFGEDNYIRIAIKTKDENDDIIESIRKSLKK